MPVAVIADVHGNIDALEAVLSEIQREGIGSIVVAGDVVAGPHQRETLGRLMALEGARFVRGNVDRVLVQAFDEQWPFDPDEQSIARKMGGWGAARLSRDERDFLAAFQDRVELTVDGVGDVLVCHGSPRSDEEIMTSRTPDDVLREILDGVAADVVVCGHTHVQFDRSVDGVRVVNAGSVGMPYEGRRGAFWLALGPRVDHRRTDYDVERAVERLRASDYWDEDDFARQLLEPLDPRAMEELFESYPRQISPGGANR